MARIREDLQHINTIIISEESVSSMFNNTLCNTLFDLLTVALAEGYNVRFLGVNNTPTNIQDLNHLRNYFRMHTGKLFSF